MAMKKNKMKLNINAPYNTHAALCYLLDKDSQETLIRKARTDLQDYYFLTIEQTDCLAFKSYAQRKTLFNLSDHISILQHFWYLGFVQFLNNEFAKALKALKTPDYLVKDYERQATRNLLPVSFTENLLIFARNYFGLPSFTQASKTPLAELLLALKDKTNTDIFQRSVMELQIKQMRAKSHAKKL